MNNLSNGDLKFISRKNLPIVLCPRSNLFLNQKLPNLNFFLKYEKVGLGTDGLSSNFSINFLDEIKFLYRGTNLPNDLIITSVTLKGEIKNKDIIEKKQFSFIEKKKISQPSQIKTCGSTFKNLSSEKKAWQLIKETGSDKFKEGDATISRKHCNFFVNNGNAKSSDIEKLINKVKQRVIDKTGVNLELEIKIVGE